MTIWIVLGAAMFVSTAIMGEQNALWIPALVLIFAAAANIPKMPKITHTNPRRPLFVRPLSVRLYTQSFHL